MKKYKTSYLKKSVVCVSLLFAGCGSQVHKNDVVTVEYAKPRVIHTTDLGADPDDEQSLVRQLVMANEFDIEGLIVATGCWKKSQSDTSMLDKVVDAYRQAYPNLRVHAEGFPSPDYLQSISVMGQLGYGMEDLTLRRERWRFRRAPPPIEHGMCIMGPHTRPVHLGGIVGPHYSVQGPGH